MITYISVGWIIRSFYWNTIDQEMAYEVIEGKITTDLIKPVSVQWMWISRAIGESAFRLGLPDAAHRIRRRLCVSRAGPSSLENFLLFMVAVLGSFFLMAALNFMIGTCAIPLTSILALIRAKYWLFELLSGVLIPMTFSRKLAQKILALLPFEHIAYTPLADLSRKAKPRAGASCARDAVDLGHCASGARAVLVESLGSSDHHSRRLRL